MSLYPFVLPPFVLVAQSSLVLRALYENRCPYEEMWGKGKQRMDTVIKREEVANSPRLYTRYRNSVTNRKSLHTYVYFSLLTSVPFAYSLRGVSCCHLLF